MSWVVSSRSLWRRCLDGCVVEHDGIHLDLDLPATAIFEHLIAGDDLDTAACAISRRHDEPLERIRDQVTAVAAVLVEHGVLVQPPSDDGER